MPPKFINVALYCASILDNIFIENIDTQESLCKEY